MIERLLMMYKHGKAVDTIKFMRLMVYNDAFSLSIEDYPLENNSSILGNVTAK